MQMLDYTSQIAASASKKIKQKNTNLVGRFQSCSGKLIHTVV